MIVDYVPLLQRQRDLYRLPRTMERFQEYLRVMLNAAGDDVALPPLVIMNPMAREHVADLLDSLLALDADGEAARCLSAAAPRLAQYPGRFQAALVVADDLHGGWTNRYATEYALRFPDRLGAARQKFLAGVLWSSEPAGLRPIRDALLTAVYRAVYQQQFGVARTLGEKLAQESFVLQQAEVELEPLPPSDVRPVEEAIELFALTDEMPTAIAILMGDEAARSLGMATYDLPPWAGLRLAGMQSAGQFLAGLQSAQHPLSSPRT
jgi:hypothetical protein